MNKCLIGYTGFVGGNLVNQTFFDEKYNSKNIGEIRGKEFDLVICAGVRAEKFLANKYPEKDLESIKELIETLKTFKTKQFVLISTIDVYKCPISVDEMTEIELEGLHPYGYNRYYLETWVKENFENYLIVRLPALFGKGIKKNFIYDLMTVIPSMIMGSKMDELLSLTTDRELLLNVYQIDGNGNYKLRDELLSEEKDELIKELERLGFTSSVFTDERSRFPFFDLSFLWMHIDQALKQNIKLLNIAVEPTTAKEVAAVCFNKDFSNKVEGKEPVNYDMKSIYAEKLGGADGYLWTKKQVFERIKLFANGEVK